MLNLPAELEILCGVEDFIQRQAAAGAAQERERRGTRPRARGEDSMFIKKLANLVNVKTIVTFAVTAVFVRLSFSGGISSETAMAVVIMVLGFYFGTQHERHS
jgi:hypothetical protein